MELLPEEELKPKSSTHFAPMIDFLFLMLALFATLAMSRSSLFDSSIELSKLSSNESGKKNNVENAQVNVSINQNGDYFWISELSAHPMASSDAVIQEITLQYEKGLIPKEKKQTEIYLHIDKRASWDPIAQLILKIKELGFEVKPLYEADK